MDKNVQTEQQKFRLIKYFKDSVVEIRKVVWPKRADAMRITIFVIVFIAVFTAFIYGVDTIISVLFNLILVRG